MYKKKEKKVPGGGGLLLHSGESSCKLIPQDVWTKSLYMGPFILQVSEVSGQLIVDG